MAKITPELRLVAEDTYVCIADADTRAVMGAKTSRARDIESRWKELFNEEHEWGVGPEEVQAFLDENLAGYGHASIGEMAELWVHLKHLGWPMAWLLEDYPLFRGQEVSTRAVDMTRADRMCVGAPAILEYVHKDWVRVFQELKAASEHTTGYKFDNIRWALPGTIPAGVTLTGDARTTLRHLEQIEGMGGDYAMIAQRAIAGIEAYAPHAAKALRKGPRTPMYAWSADPLPRKADLIDSINPKKMGEVFKVRRHETVDLFKVTHNDVQGRGAARLPRRDKIEHLDRSWESVGVFSVMFTCSVAAARDWHRHRAVMPWEMSPVIYDDGTLCKAAYEHYPEMYDPKYDSLWEQTSAAYAVLMKSARPWDALYALPFGARVVMQCRATLPSLLYMLELRAGAGGANFEYKAQAIQGLRALADAAGPEITERAGLTLLLDSLGE